MPHSTALLADPARSTILVKIVSYRDSELAKTVSSALTKASNPERVHFAIVSQECEQTSTRTKFFETIPRTTITRVGWWQARGIGWARHLTDHMRTNQDFTLQIDAHSRFSSGWDTTLVRDWLECDDPTTLLTCYPGSYAPADAGNIALTAALPHRIGIVGHTAEGIPQLNHTGAATPHSLTGVVAGGLQFGPGWISSQIPQLAAVCAGDESAQALRLFTHGITLRVPTTVPVFHLYARHKASGKHFSMREDFSSTSTLQRVTADMDNRNLAALTEIFHPGPTPLLGQAKSRDQWFELNGIAGITIRPPRPTITSVSVSTSTSTSASASASASEAGSHA